MHSRTKVGLSSTSESEVTSSPARLLGQTLLHLVLVIACYPIIAVCPSARIYLLRRQIHLRRARAELSAG